jgi:patatin-like phospholipase/acyl hydrolase
MSRYRILSMDGGGIRGLITAILLERLEAAQPGFLSKVDLFAGTSTGGLLALGLASGKTPTQARELYETYGEKVFHDTVLDDIRDLGSLIGADYDLEPLKEALEIQFGDLTLGDLNKRVLISSFHLDNHPSDPTQPRAWKAKFFHNYPGMDSDAGESLVNVGIYTSAAPTYFPIYQGYIDGGVVAGNPSVCALAQAIHPLTGGQKLDDVVLLSISTGFNPRYVDSFDGDWGLVQWAPLMVELVLEGSSGLADYQCRQFLSERYQRINPILPEPIKMDKVNKMPLMRQVAARENLTGAIQWLREYF